MIPSEDEAPHEAEVRIPPADLEGTLTWPAPGARVVVFAHDSGSSRTIQAPADAARRGA